MAKPGPVPKPVELKIFEGNPGKQKLPANYPKPASAIPSCPNWLGREAKREWKRITPYLHRLGLLSQIDRAALAAYCQAFDRWYKAERRLTQFKGSFTFTTESGYVGIRPEVSIAQKAIAQMVALCREFGMTPSARGRIEIPEGVDPTLDDLLAG